MSAHCAQMFCKTKYSIKQVASQGLIYVTGGSCLYSLIQALFRLIEAVTEGSESELSLHPETVGWIQ